MISEQGAWSDKAWGEIATLHYGKDLRNPEPGSTPVYGTNGPTGKSTSLSIGDGPTIVVGRKGAYRGVTWAPGPFWVIDTAFFLEPAKGIDLRWAYYALLTQDLNGLDSGSAIPSTRREDFYALRAQVPPLGEQRRIAAVLDALQSKIEANQQMEERLWGIARHHFRDATASNPTQTCIGDVVTFHNRRRCPLSARERGQRPGLVPYYGATGVFGFVDEALFDEVLILVGEDGSVVTPSGRPVTQYIWGQAWINNHAHVLTGDGVSTELALLAIEQAVVTPWVTGAVQPKLNMGNLKQVPLTLPHPGRRAQLESVLEPLFALLRSKAQEDASLSAVRDELLPKLVGGRLRVEPNLLADLDEPVAV